MSNILAHPERFVAPPAPAHDPLTARELSSVLMALAGQVRHLSGTVRATYLAEQFAAIRWHMPIGEDVTPCVLCGRTTAHHSDCLAPIFAQGGGQ